MKRAAAIPGYLPADALHFLFTLYRHYRAFFLVGALLAWSVITLILRQRFHRGGMDLVFFALAIMIILAFISACLYLLATRSGYHFFL